MTAFTLQSRLFWLFVLIGHGVGAALWVGSMPRGFPSDHPRFWANVVAPIAVIVAATIALAAARRGRVVLVRGVLIALAGMWMAAALSGRIAFPISLQLRWLAPLALSAAVMVAACARHLRSVRLSASSLTLSVLIGGGVGALLPWLQRAPDPSTRPLNEPLANISPESGFPATEQPRTRRSGMALVQPNDGQITIGQGRYVLYVQPLLTFVSRSPDRCWTSLAPRAFRIGPRRRLLQVDDDGRMHYDDDGRSMLVVTGDANGATVVAHSELRQPIYSHLNTFCELQVAGHRKLAVSFSPCPNLSFDVLPSDYPVGRPARCAYLGADGELHIVEAASGEKGPFRELARGPLRHGQPLSITFHDNGQPFCTVTLDDFASQASTALSPTAGWGLPMNAIEFSLSGERDSAPANLFVTLAGTSVGRGWDSVGHMAGTYRNRMSIHMLGPAATVAAATTQGG